MWNILNFVWGQRQQMPTSLLVGAHKLNINGNAMRQFMFLCFSYISLIWLEVPNVSAVMLETDGLQENRGYQSALSGYNVAIFNFLYFGRTNSENVKNTSYVCSDKKQKGRFMMLYMNGTFSFLVTLEMIPHSIGKVSLCI